MEYENIPVIKMVDIKQKEREKLLRKSYANGYQYFEHSHIELEDMEHLSVLCSDSHGNYSLKHTFWDIEDYFGFKRGKHDWDNFGIYGIIEDSSSCYESGAKDAIENKEFNPERISHMWEY